VALAVLAGVTLTTVAGVGLGAALARQMHGPAAPARIVAAVDSSATGVAGTTPSSSPSAASSPTAQAVRPVSIQIPAISVHTTLQELGLDASGELAPPTNLTQAGWYTGSPVPGQNGPSVIAGHVDSYTGPAVFFQLKSLKPGDTITVGLSSGTKVVFRVTLVQRYPKNEFPTADVYGARPDPELRLITCGGSFASGHYLDNVVVYAALPTGTTQ